MCKDCAIDLYHPPSLEVVGFSVIYLLTITLCFYIVLLSINDAQNSTRTDL